MDDVVMDTQQVCAQKIVRQWWLMTLIQKFPNLVNARAFSKVAMFW